MEHNSGDNNNNVNAYNNDNIDNDYHSSTEKTHRMKITAAATTTAAEKLLQK